VTEVEAQVAHAKSIRDPKDVLTTILNPEQRGTLYPYFHRLRKLAPVHPTDQLGPNRKWVLTGYDDMNTVYHDKAMISDSRNVAIFDAGEGGKLFYEMMQRLLLYLDPEGHRRVRGLVSQAFTPRSVEERRSRMQSVADELLDRGEDAGRMDLVSEFAYLLPVTVICEMMGIPPADLPLFFGWAHDFARRGDVSDITPARVDAGEEATVGFTGYFMDFIRARRKQPRADLISAMVEVHDESGGLSDDEIVAACIILLQAGHETTSDLIGMGTYHLLSHPDELSLLRADPSLLADAVEELLRYDTSVQIAQRVGPEDIVLSGVTVPAGEVLVLLNGAANRDPAAFHEPDRLDIRRSGKSHLSFGLGVHHCLGASLARQEIQIALSTLFTRFPKLELVNDKPDYRPSLFLRGLANLRVTLS
jgi:cytochrome P450